MGEILHFMMGMVLLMMIGIIGLAMVSGVFAFLDHFLFDDKIFPIFKNKIQKLFRVA